MFERFDENPAMTLRVIKEKKRYGRTDGRTHGRTHGRTDARTDNVKTVYPLQTKFAGGIIKVSKGFTRGPENILELWRPFCLAEWNLFVHFGRGHYEEH